MSHRPHFHQLPGPALMFTKGQVIIKGKGEGIINQGRSRRKRLRNPKKGGASMHPAGRKQGRGLPEALFIDQPHPRSHRNSLQRSDSWLTSLLYSQHLEQSLAPHRCKINIWWMNEVHGADTGFLNGWVHRSLLFCFFFPSFTKSFQTAFGPAGAFSKDT